jgi:DNA polymerase I-like protein with 3'-5' exonuclease and polymerase domains
LEALAIAHDPGAEATSTTVLLRGGSTGVLTNAAVLAGLASLVGADGLGVVAHDAKELMRTLLPLGIDVVGLTVDTAVAAYLLDPSVDTYRLTDLAGRFLGVELSDGTAAAGQVRL